MREMEEKRQREIEALEARNRAESYRKKIMESPYTAALQAAENGSKKKSHVKAAGIKSAFYLRDGKYLVTSFGQGNESIPEYLYDSNELMPIGDTQTIQAHKEVSETDTLRIRNSFSSSDYSVNTRTVFNQKRGIDLIDCKDKLEMMYFGKTFEDNIHIQIIYNILDIEKIISTHINHIVYSLNNLSSIDSDDKTDIIGNPSFDMTYDKFIQSTKDKNKQLATLIQQLTDSVNSEYIFSLFPRQMYEPYHDIEYYHKKMYYILFLLGLVRQSVAHGSETTRASIYMIDSDKNSSTRKDVYDEAKQVLDEIYQGKVNMINQNFLDLAQKDLDLLFRILRITEESDKITVIQDYYRFIIIKDYKNQGISYKRIRADILAMHCPDLLQSGWDDYRKRINRYIDFLVYRYYETQNETVTNGFISKLRAAENAEQLNMLYIDEAGRIWESIRDTLLIEIVPNLKKMIQYYKGHLPQNCNVYLNDVRVQNDALYYSKLIYLLTCFLDTKEANDLVTSLIHKYDNIDSLIRVAKVNLSCDFPQKYPFFLNSKRISTELRIINSFANLQEQTKNASFNRIKQAVQVLSIGKTEEEIISECNTIMADSHGMNSANSGMRNFLKKNVADLSTFKYVIRYGKIHALGKIGHNRKIVSFVVENLPDQVVLDYYNSCVTGKHLISLPPNARIVLVNKILNISTDALGPIRKEEREKRLTRNEIKERYKKRMLIKLYLFIIYTVQKNLVQINSRYFLAFHCVERDHSVYNCRNNSAPKELGYDYSEFATAFLKDHPSNKRSYQYRMDNIKASDPWTVRQFRNCVSHLTALRFIDRYIDDIGPFNSYYELYHYLVQRYLAEKFDEKATDEVRKDPKYKKIIHCFKMVKTHNSYNKDLVKLLCVPFAYNLPRYKNLTIEGLFDRNNMHFDKDKDCISLEDSCQQLHNI